MAKGRRRKGGQEVLRFRTHGGRRAGAGRPARAERKGFIAHVARPEHLERNPVHVTMRAKSRRASFRSERTFHAIARELRRATRGDFRVVHFSVQHDHVHMIVEADDRVRLWRGVQRFCSRVAMEINRLTGRAGSLWRDRYHRHDLASPRAVRNALVYVLQNAKKHTRGIEEELELDEILDPYSSAGAFDGWHPRAGPRVAFGRKETIAAIEAVTRPRTWLAARGWKRHGLVRFAERPQQLR